jgi:CRP/FNR family transcriptional regulator, cyclic AMP receptor protein
MPETKTNNVPSQDLFHGLSDEEVREVERVTRTRTFSRGEVIYTPGETGEALFLLREGAVQIYRMSPEGRKLVIAHLLPHSFFGELSCIGQGMYDTFAEVTEASVIVMMNCDVLNELLIRKPQIARRILEAFGRRVLEAERQLEDTVFKGMTARVAAILLREANGDEVDGLTHQDIAERLGVYRETATNALNELKASALISIGRKHIRILDRTRLEQVASE